MEPTCPHCKGTRFVERGPAPNVTWCLVVCANCGAPVGPVETRPNELLMKQIVALAGQLTKLEASLESRPAE